MNRFSKGTCISIVDCSFIDRPSADIDTIDNMLGDGMRMFVATFANILGAIILIAIVLPWFLIAVGVVSVAYIWAAIFYRASARELKVCFSYPARRVPPDICSV